jgi:ADP-heptose:LPS heptosyltransferase
VSLYVPHVRKIAILRANALGDFIVTLPAIHAIRNVYPEAELVLLGRPWHKYFLEGNRTPINRVIVIPVCSGLREEHNEVPNEPELERFFAESEKEQFDIAIHFQGKGIAANPFLNRLGARLTVGLTCPEATRLDRSLDFYYYQNEVMRYLEVASLIGAVMIKLEPEINILQKDREEALAYLSNYDNAPFIVLHPCGTDGRRMWDMGKFSQLGDRLSKKKYKIIFTGSADDTDKVASIIYSMKYPAINACGKLSLGGLIGLFAESRLMVSIDTGPLHLAQAAGIKTVGIYWAPNFINWAPLTRSNHRPVISWELQCPSCGIIPNDPYPYEPMSSKCAHPFSFISGITVEMVAQQVLTLLKVS